MHYLKKMSKLCAELELKFLSLETKIESKIKHVNSLYNYEIELINEKFSIDHLKEKYSSGFNIYREELIKQVAFKTGLEINQVNEELINSDDKSEFILLQKFRKCVFKSSLVNQARICIWKLVIKEFKFRKKFTTAQLIKYQNILKISHYLMENADEEEETGLTLATLYGCIEAVKYLVENGADLNAKYHDNDTALMIASANGYLEICKYLVENGARVDERDSDFIRALILASLYGHIDIVKYLVENGAYVNASNKKSKTALLFASENGHFEIVKFLFENGADLNAIDENNDTALILASANGHLEIVKYLAQKCVETHASDRIKDRAISIASERGHLNIV